MLQRDQTIIIKVSKAEKATLQSRAGAVPLSRYVRDALLGEPAKPPRSVNVTPREVVPKLEEGYEVVPREQQL